LLCSSETAFKRWEGIPLTQEEEGEFQKLQKLSLHLPLEQSSEEDDSHIFEPLNTQEIRQVMIRSMITVPVETQEKDEPPEFESLREKVIADFPEVFRNSLFPEPPVRGLYGYATIELKPDAVPQRQKSFTMHGVRGEVYKKIVQDWKDKFFFEPVVGRSEWGCQGFPVPKKSAEFPWRGVVDLRGPNSQMRHCNFPLPKIEDILIRQGGNQMFSILDLKKAFHQ